jgi:hypothetical protein
MNTKPDLSKLLADTGGSARHKPAMVEETPPAPKARSSKAKPSQPEETSATSAITLHFPRSVRSLLKILAIEKETTLHGVAAEAFNDFFAKNGKPEIAPKDSAALAE